MTSKCSTFSSYRFKCPVAPLDIDGDQLSGFLTPCNQQVEDACKMIQEDEKLKDGYNALGFSQVTFNASDIL